MAIGTLINGGLGAVTSFPASEIVGSLLLSGCGRTIMGLFADVTVEEKHKDELKITEHPTEVGAAISDHAYKEPPEVMMKVGWSESAGTLNGFLGDTILGGNTSLTIVYQTLLQLQDQALPLIISTGKRLYTNMLIKSLACTTDLQTENVLMIDITFKKVIMVSTQTTFIAIENQASPEVTAGVADGGTVQAEPLNESALSKTTGFIKSVLFGE
ncbi:phage baseplate protein [Acinetobacter haemolyticus]|uniref:phage baseplate protein n=1 Tax=Acinetobacter haemolyticus TaxID=29430 RepID=UPI003EF82257